MVDPAIADRSGRHSGGSRPSLERSERPNRAGPGLTPRGTIGSGRCQHQTLGPILPPTRDHHSCTLCAETRGGRESARQPRTLTSVPRRAARIGERETPFVPERAPHPGWSPWDDRW
ncbi:hypothetical protein NDU88_002883 [Pleurodeles waltl]|uniref:Uncharacterized protein n=1 Tax=Pleurodeles waltl TaxID=8319 RepID=A0AAV7SER6_PLEWA|nr:hypothetical protein NDU88_002883 [Pleurodeles waltl]